MRTDCTKLLKGVTLPAVPVTILGAVAIVNTVLAVLVSPQVLGPHRVSLEPAIIGRLFSLHVPSLPTPL